MESGKALFSACLLTDTCSASSASFSFLRISLVTWVAVNPCRRSVVISSGRARITEHDIRAKCASDAETLEHARALLARADGRTTERVYRRKPERVKPLR